MSASDINLMIYPPIEEGREMEPTIEGLKAAGYNPKVVTTVDMIGESLDKSKPNILLLDFDCGSREHIFGGAKLQLCPTLGGTIFYNDGNTIEDLIKMIEESVTLID